MLQNNNKPDTGTPDTLSISAIQGRLTALEGLTRELQARTFPINFNTDIQGLFETVSAAPTNIPKSPYDQVKIYVNGATYRLYWYDGVGHAWHYVTATA